MCPGDKIVTNALFSTIVTQVIRVFFYNHLSKKMGSQNIQGIQFIGGFLFSQQDTGYDSANFLAISPELARQYFRYPIFYCSCNIYLIN